MAPDVGLLSQISRYDSAEFTVRRGCMQPNRSHRNQHAVSAPLADSQVPVPVTLITIDLFQEIHQCSSPPRNSSLQSEGFRFLKGRSTYTIGTAQITAIAVRKLDVDIIHIVLDCRYHMSHSTLSAFCTESLGGQTRRYFFSFRGILIRSLYLSLSMSISATISLSLSHLTLHPTYSVSQLHNLTGRSILSSNLPPTTNQDIFLSLKSVCLEWNPGDLHGIFQLDIRINRTRQMSEII